MSDTTTVDYGRTKIDDNAKAGARKVYRFFRGLFAVIGILAVASAALLAAGVWAVAT